MKDDFMINILQLHSSAGLYGAESVIMNLAMKLEKAKYHAIIGSIENIGEGLSDFYSAVRDKNMDAELIAARGRVNPHIIFKIIKVIKKRNIRLLHSHSYKASVMGYCAARACKIPLVETNHLYPPMPLDDRKLQLYAKMELYFLRYFDRVIAVSHRIKKEIEESGVDKRKVMVIENGIELGNCGLFTKEFKNKMRKDLNFDANDFIVGGIGRLTEQKGFEFMVRAAKNIVARSKRKVIFLILGEGPLRAHLTKMIEREKMQENVKLFGFRKDVLNVISALDVFLMPSIDEGLPMAMLEAMAACVPVVVTRVGDIPSVIMDGENGVLIDPRNDNQIQEKISYLIENELLRAKLASNGLKTVQANYSNDAMSGKYAMVYDELIGIYQKNEEKVIRCVDEK